MVEKPWRSDEHAISLRATAAADEMPVMLQTSDPSSIMLAVVQMSGEPLAKLRIKLTCTIAEVGWALGEAAGVRDTPLLLASGQEVLDGQTTVWKAGLRDGSVLTAIRYPQLFVAAAYEDGHTRLWSVETGRCESLTDGVPARGAVLSVAFAPRGRRVATGSMDGFVSVWCVISGRQEHVIHCHKGPISALAFSPDSSMIATGGFDRSARLWMLSSGECLGRFPGHHGSVGCLAFTPDGGLLATTSEDGLINLWDASSTNQHVAAYAGHQGSVLALCFGHNGRLLVSGSTDATGKLWSVRSGSAHHTFIGHAGSVCSVALSSDMTMVATGCMDGTVRLWGVKRGGCLLTLQGHSLSMKVRWVTFSPGGTLLATGSDDGTVKLWGIAGGACKHTFQGYQISEMGKRRPASVQQVIFFAGPTPE
mmetsp:Transcript_7710/g.21810  ORF Transcript_7710/g.21810 Transcript_7710/m.21810 type:complete len:422 (-) Transcript_7710:26-1291(-)